MLGRLRSLAIVAAFIFLALAAPKPARSMETTCGACRDHCIRQNEKYRKTGRKNMAKYSRLMQDCIYEECGACSNGEPVKVRDGRGMYTGELYYSDPANPGFPVHALPYNHGTGGLPPLDIRVGDEYVAGKLTKRVAAKRVPYRIYIREFRLPCVQSATECMRETCVEYEKHKEACGGLEDQVNCVIQFESRLLAMTKLCIAKGKGGIRLETPEETAEHREHRRSQ